jgi:hypothetical protein
VSNNTDNHVDHDEQSMVEGMESHDEPIDEGEIIRQAAEARKARLLQKIDQVEAKRAELKREADRYRAEVEKYDSILDWQAKPIVTRAEQQAAAKRRKADEERAAAKGAKR